MLVFTITPLELEVLAAHRRLQEAGGVLPDVVVAANRATVRITQVDRELAARLQAGEIVAVPAPEICVPIGRDC